MKMRQIQQQEKQKSWEIIITVLGAIVVIGLFAFVTYDNFKLQNKLVKTTLKNPIQREMNRNKYERDLARQHGKNLKAIFDYVDR